MTKIKNPRKHMTLVLTDYKLFIGCVVEKVNTISVCIGIDTYINKKGESIPLLVFESSLKGTKRKSIKKIMAKPFRISDLPSTEKAFEQNYFEE